MRRSMHALAPILVLFAVAAGAAEKYAKKAAPRTITFGSQSEPALAQVREALQLLEGLAPGARYRVLAQKAVEADPSFAFAHYLVGVTFPPGPGKPHTDKALELAAKAPDGERRYVEAAILGRGPQKDEAIAALEKMKGDYPDEPLVRISLGQLYLGAGQLDKATEALEAAVSLNPSSARAHVALGNTLLLKGDYAGARGRFEAAREKLAQGVAPGPVRYGMAMSHLYEGRSEDAIRTLRQYLEEYRKAASTPNPEVFIWNSMARIHLESGNAEAALAAYEKGFESVKSSTDLPERQRKLWFGRLHHGRGRALARLGKHQEAWAEAEVVKKMIDEGGEDGKEFLPAYHYLAGYLKLESGETDAAIEHLMHADADDPFHMLLLARAYEKRGDKENARKAYQGIVDSKQNNLERALAYPVAKTKLP